MNFRKRSRSLKIELRCYKCKGQCAAKDGDWHASPIEDSQQVFLCRVCEGGSKPARQLKSLAPAATAAVS